MNSPLFIGDWDSLAMVHLEVAPCHLQRSIPFELALFEGTALVSLVFFTMRNMRLACAPSWLNRFFHPVREQRCLNVRTYVRHRGERGIHFITEWISNPLCVPVGSLLYGLPLRAGRHEFAADETKAYARVSDRATKASLECHFIIKEPLRPCEPGTRHEFVFEKYAAFNSHGQTAKSFRVSHLPWEQCPAEATITDTSLLSAHFPWFPQAHITGANYSPGVRDVLITRPSLTRNAESHSAVSRIFNPQSANSRDAPNRLRPCQIQFSRFWTAVAKRSGDTALDSPPIVLDPKVNARAIDAVPHQRTLRQR